MLNIILQCGIAGFGLLAIVLVYANDNRVARWAPVFGLCAQPFWVASAAMAEQWGILLLSVFYVYGWWKGIEKHWINWPRYTPRGDVLR